VALGEKIKQLREAQNLTRKELADKLKLTYTALSKYETNEREPDFKTLQRIANFFGVSADELIAENIVESIFNTPKDFDFSPLEKFVREFENLKEDDQKDVMKELFTRVLEGDKKKNK
jgi:transcriptional regulator with XRE-family HTH domain